MKIENGLRPALIKGTEQRRGAPVEKTNFRDMVKGEGERLSNERLQTLLKEIDAQGEILARSRNVRDYYAYRTLIKRFMEEAVRHGVTLDERKVLNRRGRSRVHKIVKEIDAELLALADELLSEEAPLIDMLARIGEIRGMLINLYF
ncbi:YaaR family protein [Brevibacillus daliensis]|uniref:YaaR family protein n=1 Tax=Brevibacillus daliensis TaxID=2892995 RepID=UPI001E49D681|nr:YaaR family protein [Brevibacillus daliensis]